MAFSWVPPRWLHVMGQRSRKGAAQAFEAAAADPHGTQRRYLQALLEAQRGTEYGRLHGFKGSLGPEAYAAQVPIMTPDDLRGWVDRLARGERNLLATAPPVFYGRSSGTSGVPKWVPVTEPYRQEFQQVVQVAFWHLCNRFPEAFRGRVLYAVGERRAEVAPDGNDVGTMSGYNFTEQPKLVQALYAWPYPLFTVADSRSRAHLALLLALAGEASLVVGVFPLPILSLLRDLEKNWELLAHDLERGSLEGAPGLSAAEKAYFSPLFKPRPDLARRVRQSAQVAVEEKVGIALPLLRLVYCWTTATASIYVPELRRRLGPGVALRDAIYAATEAWCNVPMGDEEPGGPLALGHVYYEFIPEADYERGGREALPLEAIREGQRYVIVVSNSAGLYRYVIGDVVEVYGRWKGIPCVRFVRKTGATSNMAGELLDESHPTMAVSTALQVRGLESTYFTIVANRDLSALGYELKIELAPSCAEIPDEELQALTQEVDRRMGQVAVDYQDLRVAGKLQPLAVKRLEQGRTAAWQARRMREGAAEAQLKTVPLYGDPAAVPEEFR